MPQLLIDKRIDVNSKCCPEYTEGTARTTPLFYAMFNSKFIYSLKLYN